MNNYVMFVCLKFEALNRSSFGWPTEIEFHALGQISFVSLSFVYLSVVFTEISYASNLSNKNNLKCSKVKVSTQMFLTILKFDKQFLNYRVNCYKAYILNAVHSRLLTCLLSNMTTQQINEKHINEKRETRNGGRFEMRIIENMRKIMANIEFSEKKNEKNRKYKITVKENI